MKEKVYTVNQIAEMFEMHPKTIRRYIKEGGLTARKIGGEWRIAETDVKAFLDGNTEFTEQLADRSEEELMELMQGNSDPQKGKIQVATVVDLFVQSVEEAQRVSMALMDVINTKAPEKTKAKFRYFFDPDELRVRVILFGSPRYIQKMMNVLGDLDESLSE